jgi:hypothetical protein
MDPTTEKVFGPFYGSFQGLVGCDPSLYTTGDFWLWASNQRRFSVATPAGFGARPGALRGATRGGMEWPAVWHHDLLLGAALV